LDNNWIIENLENALNTWGSKFDEILSMLTQSPEQFRDGQVWGVILNVNSALKGIGYALLVLFFAYGAVRTCASFDEVKKPEKAFRLFIRFILAKGLISYGTELMMAIVKIVQGVISSILAGAGVSGQSGSVSLPDEIKQAVNECTLLESIPLWIVTLLGVVLIWGLSLVLILSVYGRFFKLYMYTAISPIPMASFAGQPTENMGRSFLKSYLAVCLEGAVIVLACIIYSIFASSPPALSTSSSAVTKVWCYVGELLFNMFILTGTVRISDRVVHEMLFS
jgi:hypothetical protein